MRNILLEKDKNNLKIRKKKSAKILIEIIEEGGAKSGAGHNGQMEQLFFLFYKILKLGYVIYLHNINLGTKFQNDSIYNNQVTAYA